MEETKNAFLSADYLWVGLGLFIAFLSHFSRAYRWLFLLRAMDYQPKLSSAYHSVMSGYIINFTVPRSGEIARAGLLATSEKIPFEKGFATIVIERVIDVIMLGFVVLISGYLQTNSDEFQKITEQGAVVESSSWMFYAVIAAALLGLIGLLFFLKNEWFRNFVLTKMRGFYEGLKSIWTMKQKWAYIGHTLFIWVAYVGSIWVFAQAFPETSGMSLACMFGAFVVGAAAIAVLPGGIGAYPTWVNAVLVLYGINFPAYGIFIWVAQTVLILVLGLLSLYLIQRKKKQ